MSTLPKKNEKGFFEIRLESIGGLGANLVGKLLAEAGVLGQGLNGANFSSYGSEKKGTPVQSFIRFADYNQVIHDHSPVHSPHVIGVFHEALYKTLDVASGLLDDGIILVNTDRSFSEVVSDLKISHGTLAILDAMSIAIDEKSRINMAMLGALCKIIDFLPLDFMQMIIRNKFANKSPEVTKANLRAFERGYQEVRFQKVEMFKFPSFPKKEKESHHLQFGYLNQPIGGVIPCSANSMLKNMSGSRIGFIPVIDLDGCIHCAACDLVCPDLCFVWEQGEDKKGRPQMFLKGIDYQYCKGCLKCIEACPTNAISSLRETKAEVENMRVAQNYPFIAEEVL